MANLVKFFRLGKENPVDSSIYESYKLGDAFNGGIIFANVKDPNDESKTLQYIWANGIEYNVGQGSSNVHIDVSTVVPEEAGLTPSHGDYYIREEVITEKPNAEPRRTAYIFDSTIGEDGKWVILDGNVDATNVFFKDGVDRTAAIGVLPATTGGAITNEGKALNLKELLEYYLVQETYPTPTITTGSASVPAYTITLNKPNNISTYMSSTTNLVEVGTQITFNGISLNENATHNGKETYTSTKSEIKGMSFGAATSIDGPVDPNLKSASEGPINTTATYEHNFNSANAIISLTKNSGFNGINNATASVVVNGNNLVLSAATGTVVEGENKLTLNWTSDASVKRIITTDETIPAMEYYYASNKGNLSSDKKASTNEVSWVDSQSTATVSNTSSTFNVTAVYPIFINGTIKTEQELIDGGQGVCGWYNNTYSGEPVNKLNIFDYNKSNKEYIVTFGPNNNGETNYPRVFIPEDSTGGASITIERDWSKENAWKETYSRVVWEYENNTVNIEFNGITKAYRIYTCKAVGVGGSAFKLNILKK